MKIIFVLMMAIISLNLISCSSTYEYPKDVRIEPPALPQYPNTEQEETRFEKSKMGGSVQITTFKTQDPSQSVINFYKDLVKLGWKNPAQDNDFLYIINEQACPLYVLYVNITRPTTDTAIFVELKLVPTSCVGG
jgi:hypothetical protein